MLADCFVDAPEARLLAMTGRRDAGNNGKGARRFAPCPLTIPLPFRRRRPVIASEGAARAKQSATIYTIIVNEGAARAKQSATIYTIIVNEGVAVAKQPLNHTTTIMASEGVARAKQSVTITPSLSTKAQPKRSNHLASVPKQPIS
jgi:hypothetical protein